jgi:hypothetical protein
MMKHRKFRLPAAPVMLNFFGEKKNIFDHRCDDTDTDTDFYKTDTGNRGGKAGYRIYVQPDILPDFQLNIQMCSKI